MTQQRRARILRLAARRLLRRWTTTLDVWDNLGLAGATLFTAGAGCVYLPLVLLLPGGFLLALSLLGARRWRS